MNNGHLRDDHIQEILDDMMLGPARPLPAHLNACAACREKFEQYSRLYARLAADPGFMLPPTFADAVLQRIPVPRPLLWARPTVWIPLTPVVFTLAIAGLSVFVDLKPLSGQITRLATELATAFQPLAGQFQHLLAKLNGNAHLFMLGGLGLLGAALFDRLLQRQALHRSR